MPLNKNHKRHAHFVVNEPQIINNYVCFVFFSEIFKFAICGTFLVIIASLVAIIDPLDLIVKDVSKRIRM